MKIAVFASGNGSNVQALLDNIQSGELLVEIACLITDRPKAFVVERAQAANIPVYAATLKAFESREAWEEAVVAYLEPYTVDYIVLAGFMRILKKPLLSAYPNRIINIHPSYLPAFPGKNGIKDAYEAGVSETGVTVFYVDEGIDTGKMLAQEKIAIDPEWTIAHLAYAVHAVEHRLYTQVLQQIQKEFSGKEEINDI